LFKEVPKTNVSEARATHPSVLKVFKNSKKEKKSSIQINLQTGETKITSIIL
jgi:hypothetical protein